MAVKASALIINLSFGPKSKTNSREDGTKGGGAYMDTGAGGIYPLMAFFVILTGKVP